MNHHKLGAQADSQLAIAGRKTPLRLFWGDLHNHNAVGYAKGTLARSIETAREHLDFFAFTGHASWHDMPKMPGDRHMKWVRGFDVHRKHWPKTRQMIHHANSDDFVTFLGYEWHSSCFGDYCVIFPDERGDLFLPDHVDKLLDYTHHRGALAIPHHVAYKLGWRGVNRKHFRPEASPVVEVFSEHGCTESDRATQPMIRHSNGGRSTANTIAYQLRRGLRFGFVASSDNHRGYPGAYGEGVLGVWAEELSREGLFEAIMARRTFAATGDRIGLEVTLNGRAMGEDADYTGDRQIDVRVTGQDAIAMIELVRNGRVAERYFPEDHVDGPPRLPGRAKCRLQYGWGPWAALDLGRTCDWDMTVRIEGGRFLRSLPCFQSAPYDETRRDRLRIVSESEVHLQSNTTRVKCYAEDPTKSLILEVDAGPDALFSVQLRKPIEKTYQAKLKDLLEENVVEFIGVFTSESFIIGRLLGPGEYSAAVRWQDRQPKRNQADYYYVRVTQHNGQMAWSSPIWVG